ncbi:hypothetical protein GALMADRAFT_596445 [Galerina marginata CBS 339.88]|uniref:Uncharacterized protein n=1 Tax=Galerina marginata (strain CBS 339.88) TaxID=685588 RepID=A0A067SSY9_GALM3|nr:hypothetical protein GALMADRAFT_596445 [Galerina marginata CBS 339.88]
MSLSPGSTTEVTTGVTRRGWMSGRVDRMMGGGPGGGGGAGGPGGEGLLGLTDTDDRGGGGGGIVPFPRAGNGGGGAVLGPREGKGGAGEIELLRLTTGEGRETAEEVRLGGGGKGANLGFVFWLTKLLGGGGGGADAPLYGSQLVFFIATLTPHAVSVISLETVG